MLRFGAAAGRLVIQPHLCRGIWRPLNDLWRGRASPHELPEGYLQIAIFAAQIFVLASLLPTTDQIRLSFL
jgi:hypothetical protein